MKIPNKSIRIILIIVFILISIASLLASIYTILMTAFGVGWGGGSISLLELIWKWKGLILLFLCSVLATIGLKKQNRMGIIFSYVVPVSYLLFEVYFRVSFFRLADFEKEKLDLIISIFQFAMWISIPILIIIGINKLRKENENFSKMDFTLTGVLVFVLTISLITMFNF